MPTITFVSPDNAQTSLDVRSGMTLMEAGLHNGVAGIDADCGGACSCATCQVVIDPAWRAVVGAPGNDEADMLSETAIPAEGLRLSCQIVLSDALDGLVVHLPTTQR